MLAEHSKILDNGESERRHKMDPFPFNFEKKGNLKLRRLENSFDSERKTFKVVAD